MSTHLLEETETGRVLFVADQPGTYVYDKGTSTNQPNYYLTIDTRGGYSALNSRDSEIHVRSGVSVTFQVPEPSGFALAAFMPFLLLTLTPLY